MTTALFPARAACPPPRARARRRRARARLTVARACRGRDAEGDGDAAPPRLVRRHVLRRAPADIVAGRDARLNESAVAAGRSAWRCAWWWWRRHQTPSRRRSHPARRACHCREGCCAAAAAARPPMPPRRPRTEQRGSERPRASSPAFADSERARRLARRRREPREARRRPPRWRRAGRHGPDRRHSLRAAPSTCGPIGWRVRRRSSHPPSAQRDPQDGGKSPPRHRRSERVAQCP